MRLVGWRSLSATSLRRTRRLAPLCISVPPSSTAAPFVSVRRRLMRRGSLRNGLLLTADVSQKSRSDRFSHGGSTTARPFISSAESTRRTCLASTTWKWCWSRRTFGGCVRRRTSHSLDASPSASDAARGEAQPSRRRSLRSTARAVQPRTRQPLRDSPRDGRAPSPSPSAVRLGQGSMALCRCPSARIGL